MKVTRAIHAIGQGAFYTEKFEYKCSDGVMCTCNVVYDCGSQTPYTGSGKLIDAEITQTYNKNEEILAVFISHFHEDHINGLKKLLTHCNVKNIFVPELTNENKILLLSNCNDEMSDFIMFPDNVIHYFSPETKVIEVKLSNEDDIINENLLYYLDKPNDVNQIKSGTTIHLSGDYRNCNWVFIPYNLNQLKLIQRIKNEYKKKEFNIPMPYKMTSDEIKQAKLVFKEVFKMSEEHNVNSMVLYSGSDSCENNISYNVLFNKKCKCFCELEYLCHHTRIKNGCLYMGDYNLKNGSLQELEKKYEKFIKNISLIQVPHHGSINNFDNNIFNIFRNSYMFFISAGRTNKYRHPSSKVLSSISENKCMQLVTEDVSSQIILKYKLHI